MQNNQRVPGENGEIFIDTFPDIPNSIKKVKDGVELTFGENPDEDIAFEFETVDAPLEALDIKSDEPSYEENTQKKDGFAHFDESSEPLTSAGVENKSEFDNLIHKTYVPRFTDASEKFRFANSDTNPEKAASKNSEDFDDSVDPTAETEDVVCEPDEIATSRGSRFDEPEKNTAQMFKFAETEEISESDEPVEDITEQSGEDIEIPDNTEDEMPDASDVNEESSPADSAEAFRDENVRTIDFCESKQKYDDAPTDVGDKIDESDRGEYTAPSQKESFTDKMLDSIMGVKIRFFTSAFIAFILLIAENLFLLGVNVPSLVGIDMHRGAMAILDLIFAVCLYILAIPEVIASFKNLLLKRITPEFYLSVLLVINIVYTVLLAIYAGEKYPLVGFALAILSTMAIGASYFSKIAQHTSFSLISQKGEKVVMDIKPTRELERENLALDGAIKEHVSKTVRFFRTNFISGFFKRSNQSAENGKTAALTLAIALLVGICGGVIAFFYPGGIVSASSAFALSFSLSLPAFALLSRKLPYLAVTKELKKENTAIVGERAVIDYAGADVITFEDTEVFTEDDINIQRIMLYGKNENLSKALGQMSALFQNVGGPLDSLFSNSLDRKCEPAHSTFVEEDGVSGEIDFTPVCAGTYEYMVRHGIVIPDRDTRDGSTASTTSRVIYAAENGCVYAKFLIRYSFSEEFSMILPALFEAKVTPLIYTRDPNINSDFILTLTAGNDKIRTIKKKTAPSSDDTVYRRVNSAGVVLGDKMNAITSLLLVKRYKEMCAEVSKAEIWTASLGAILGAVLSLASLSAIPTAIFAAAELLCVGGLFKFTKKKIFISPFTGEEK